MVYPCLPDPSSLFRFSSCWFLLLLPDALLALLLVLCLFFWILYLAEAKTTRNTSQTFSKDTLNKHKYTLNLPEASRSNPLNLPETKPPCRWIRVPGFGDRIPGGHLQLDLWSSPFLCLLEWTLCRVESTWISLSWHPIIKNTTVYICFVQCRRGKKKHWFFLGLVSL
jgi:hypothetical protein